MNADPRARLHFPPGTDPALVTALVPPQLPAHDPNDPVESAIIARLAGNWDRRATVRRREPDLEALFEPAKLDFPDGLIPFAGHEVFDALDEEPRNRLRAWGWIAYNKNVQDIEQQVVNPGFSLAARDVYATGLGEDLTRATLQAMVDEMYHTLMHMNASALTRNRRGWRLDDRVLPFSPIVRGCHRAIAAAESPWDAALASLAFTTVAEVSISHYLDLVEKGEEIQPANRATIRLHARDEHCHSSISADLARVVYERLSGEDKIAFTRHVRTAMVAFTTADLSTWETILRLEDVPHRSRMLRETEEDTDRPRHGEDFGDIWDLCLELDMDQDLLHGR